MQRQAKPTTRNRAGRRTAVILLTLGLLASGDSASAQSGGDLTQMSLEDLMNLEVTSVSRRTERISNAAAAVSVLTNDDIRRSGAQTVPDLLRLVPGLHVGQINSSTWSVSVRGFGSRFANKLLVLVDGRSVYTPLFSGVFWNLVNVPLDDVERIEVVRGPGATMWGANAVNGVINIITRSAAASKGGLLTASTGTEMRGLGAFRYGSTLNARTSFRVDAGGLERDGASIMFPSGGRNDWRIGRIGFRLDSQPKDSDEVGIQGSLVKSQANELWTVPSLMAPYQSKTEDQSRYTSGYVMGHWTRRTRAAETTLQLLHERSVLHELIVDERRNTINLDLQQARQLRTRHEIVWGGTYRRSADRTIGTAMAQLVPDARVLHFWSAFVQDDIALLKGRLRLTPGSKFEHNDYTAWEVQPSLRGFIAVSDRQSVWAAASRAVRLPSRGETDGVFPVLVMPPSATSPLPQILTLAQNPEGISAEKLVAYEAGYRVRPAATLSVELAIFANRYSDLLVAHLGTPAMVLAPSPHLLVPLLHVNGKRTATTGGELMVEWWPAPRLRVTGGYSRFHELPSARQTTEVGLVSGDYPEHQLHLRTAASLPRKLELDLSTRYVSAMAMTAVPAYLTADARIGTVLGRLDVSLVGQNLLAAHHLEYTPDVLIIAGGDVRRSINLRIGWRF